MHTPNDDKSDARTDPMKEEPLAADRNPQRDAHEAPRSMEDSGALPGTWRLVPASSRPDPTADGPHENAMYFVEHCILLGSRAADMADGEYIRRALELVADEHWPDIASGAFIYTDMETGELVIETPRHIYYITIRSIERGPGNRAARDA